MMSNNMETRADLAGVVQSMSAVVNHGDSDPQFAFTILDAAIRRTLYINLAKEGSGAIVAIVNAAYLLRKPLHIGLSGAFPGDVAWVQLSKPPLPTARS